MSSIALRIAKLERDIGNAERGRVITVRSEGATEEQAEAFLRSQGIIVHPVKDLLVHIQTLFLDREENPVVLADLGIKLLNVVEMRS